MRTNSSDAQTRKDALIPHLFQKIRQPESGNYLLIPSVSSETRAFVPIGYLNSHTVVSNLAFSLPHATLYHFGILCSTMHNAFMRTVAGRLKSDYRYSNTLVYNNFPFPFARSEREAAAGGASMPDKTRGTAKHIGHQCQARTPADVAKHLAAIEQAAQAVLDARAFYSAEAERENLPAPTLADFYAANAPFTRLHQAHAALDKAVDAAYGYTGSHDDAARVAFLFERYQALA